MDHTGRDQAFAELLSGVIERHTVASRLQKTVTLAEDTLSAALRIGDGVRRAVRDGDAERPNQDDCRQLAYLATRLEEATDTVLGEALALDLRRASAAGRVAESARLALGLFAGLSRPASLPPALYAGITVRRRARSGETLVHPEALADEIASYSRDGLGPASGVTTDGEVALLPEPIALAPSFAACGAEVALSRPTRGLEEGLLADDASGDLIAFTSGVAGPFSVVLARAADDEWWAASSVPYATYRRDLADALRARGIASEISDLDDAG